MTLQAVLLGGNKRCPPIFIRSIEVLTGQKQGDKEAKWKMWV